MRSLLRRILGRSGETQSPPLVSTSGTLRLRALSESDHQSLALWLSDPTSCRLAFGVDTDQETLKEMSKEYLDDLITDHRGVLWIEDSSTSSGLGFMRYKLYRKDRKCLARIGIMIGDDSRRGEGLGREALATLLFYLFENRGVDVVELDTASFNHGAQRCFFHCGFEVVREMEIIGLHNKWTEKRVIMRLTSSRWKSWKSASSCQPSPEAAPGIQAPH